MKFVIVNTENLDEDGYGYGATTLEFVTPNGNSVANGFYWDEASEDSDEGLSPYNEPFEFFEKMLTGLGFDVELEERFIDNEGEFVREGYHLVPRNPEQ